MTTPTTEPRAIQAGDTVAWRRELPDFPAGQGWSLAYKLSPIAGGSPTTVSATADGDAFACAIPAATTANLAGGWYVLRGRVTKGSEAYTVAEVRVEVRPELGNGTDVRTHEEKCLAAIEACLEGRLSDPLASYRIGDREASRIPPAELMSLRAKYKAAVDIQRGVRPMFQAVPVTFNDPFRGRFLGRRGGGL